MAKLFRLGQVIKDKIGLEQYNTSYLVKAFPNNFIKSHYRLYFQQSANSFLII